MTQLPDGLRRRRRRQAIRRIARRAALRAVSDERSPEEILGYGFDGLPV